MGVQSLGRGVSQRNGTREGHSHVRYLDALLGAEIDERGRKAVLRRVKEAGCHD